MGKNRSRENAGMPATLSGKPDDLEAPEQEEIEEFTPEQWAKIKAMAARYEEHFHPTASLFPEAEGMK